MIEAPPRARSPRLGADPSCGPLDPHGYRALRCPRCSPHFVATEPGARTVDSTPQWPQRSGEVEVVGDGQRSLQHATPAYGPRSLYDGKMDLPVGEPLETTISEPPGSMDALEAAKDASAIARVAADHPTCLTAWAELGERALAQGNPVEGYAYFRVGYHRGLDTIRKAGWRGQGRVPWSHVENRGFLRSLRGLGEAADQIGEKDEAQRCDEFFRQLAPDAP